MKTLVLKNTRGGLRAQIDGEMIAGCCEIIASGLPRDNMVTLKFVAHKVVFEQETIEEADADRAAHSHPPAHVEGEWR